MWKGLEKLLFLFGSFPHCSRVVVQQRWRQPAVVVSGCGGRWWSCSGEGSWQWRSDDRPIGQQCRCGPTMVAAVDGGCGPTVAVAGGGGPVTSRSSNAVVGTAVSSGSEVAAGRRRVVVDNGGPVAKVVVR
ncbi:hypothetical protein Q3G72_029881 [Acer saccharum]|nr:hypothetical protein Q3G72_029881 [Acer saccharum]